jgi:hypothetical protein
LVGQKSWFNNKSLISQRSAQEEDRWKEQDELSIAVASRAEELSCSWWITGSPLDAGSMLRMLPCFKNCRIVQLMLISALEGIVK